ncbi:H-NS histone family protein [Bordetella avium]|uniref:DNA-binding protein (Histone) n=1 Tax=Bordetella avium (strain 197N) TaxID=360910 RepID=Q2KZ53_BORA1|nr:H-NS histone family protein [Bordetella avium]AZY49464.1 DNA-binding protein [Bordetella avium]AZY52861.1 DNA-binding protein [Bordetella avium]RIQ12159.1 H-NS histone family protein [Bordetella avium]RIQ19021.1 H-NS histone family protein [Bordetella avium]RIQ31930.1 H-NS histone family protein [Bordetella avium]
MPRETYAAQQAKIEKEISRLQKRAEALQTRRRKPVIASIVKSMREYNITPEEIIAALGSAKSTRAAAPRRKATSDGSKRAVAPKYLHPQTGETWSGRGKAPRWLVAEEGNGASRDSFLIK